MYTVPPEPTVDGMTTTQHRRPTVTEPSSGHRRLRNRAIAAVIIVAGLMIAWWISPELGGVLTIVASVALAGILAPRPIDDGGHRAGGDLRNVTWWL
jgi:hypothetical protein